MSETIYTIPINEAFAENDGCPVCRLYEMLEKRDAEIILGASMMEPDIRIATNKLGFCPEHLSLLFSMRKKLPLDLMLESHVAELAEYLKDADTAVKHFSEVNESCYLCARINGYLDGMYNNLFGIFAEDEAFREKVKNRKFYCLPHLTELLSRSEKRLKKDDRKKFRDYLLSSEREYFAEVSKDIRDYANMFDYRNADAEWGDFKNAPEKAANLLTGKKFNQ